MATPLMQPLPAAFVVSVRVVPAASTMVKVATRFAEVLPEVSACFAVLVICRAPQSTVTVAVLDPLPPDVIVAVFGRVPQLAVVVGDVR